MTERTLILFKPDAVKRQIIGKILQRYEDKGLKIAGMKMILVTKDLAEKHYGEHKGKSFFEELIKYITSSPIIAMVLEANNAIQIARKINGATNPTDADAGSIRGDFAISKTCNLVHASDSKESAQREIGIFFSKEELKEYQTSGECWF
ncbi:MAG: hypothetical protein ACD_79C00294G0001 [uncultured bacterium]|nr:MAG: hypothetical protein ACD_79C00294G0001 [uncultured bacterium]